MNSGRLKKILGKSLRKKICAWTLIFSTMTFGIGSASVKLGDSNDEVREVQTCLTAQGLYSGEINGYCCQSTVNAIKEFQEAIGLIVDGICGGTTFELLRAAAYDEIDITTLMTNEISNFLKPGDSGARVEELQNLLIEQGYMEGTANGIYDSKTSAAVKNFQVYNEMTIDGLCGSHTLRVLKSLKSSENAEDYGRVMYVEATAYSPQDPGLGKYTARGNLVTYGIISVDPNVIPLGTRVYIPGYGEAIADDTGGSIIGNRIDIAFDTHEEAMRFGRKSIEIYIIDD